MLGTLRAAAPIACRWSLGTLLCLSGCAETSQKVASPPPTAKLFGERLFQDGPGGRRLTFEAEHLPVARIEGPLRGRPELRFIVDGQRAVLSLGAPQQRAGFTLLRVVGVPDQMPVGRGQLELLLDGQRAAAWAADWRGVPRLTPPLAEGTAHFAANRLLAALDSYRAARKHARGRTRLAATRQIAKVQLARSELSSARASWGSAADEARGLSLPGEASACLREAADVAFSEHNFVVLDALLEQAEALDTGHDNPTGLARTSWMRGRALLQLGDLPGAGRALDAARSHAWVVGDDETWRQSLLALAEVRLRQGLATEAFPLLESARPTFELRARFGPEWPRFLLLVGRAAHSIVPPRQGVALAAFEGAAEALVGQRDAQAEALTHLGWVHIATGDLPAAEAVLARARRLVDSPLSRLLEAELRLRSGRSAEAEAAFSALADQMNGGGSGPELVLAWRALFGVGRARLAQGEGDGAASSFRAALAGLAGLSRDALFGPDEHPCPGDRQALFKQAFEQAVADGRLSEAFGVADQALAEPLLTLEGQLRVARMAPRHRARWSQRAGACLSQHDRFKRRHHGPAPVEDEGLLSREAARDDLKDAYVGLRNGLNRAAPVALPDPVDGARLQGLLKPGQAVLSVFESPGQRWLLWVERAHLQVAKAAGDDLLSAFEGRLGGLRALHVVGAPRAAVRSMLLRDQGGAPLGGALDISFGAYAGLLARTAPVFATPKPYIAADPDGRQHHRRAAAKRLTEHVAAQVLLGAQAHRDALLTRLSEGTMLHFSGVGRLRSSAPLDAALYLGNGVELTAEDLFVNPPHASLVTLVAEDDSADGSMVSTRQSLDFATALHLAGVWRVLAWSGHGDTNSADAFLALFYGAGGAKTPVAAYRTAVQRSISKGDGIWAEYRLIGHP